MSSMLEPILGSLDSNIVWLFVAMMAVCLLLAIIKKAGKIILVTSILIVAAIALIPIAEDFQTNYSIGIEDSTLSISIEGKEYQINHADVESILLKNLGSEYELQVVDNSEEGGGVMHIQVPKWMLEEIRNFANKYKIAFTLQD